MKILALCVLVCAMMCLVNAEGSCPTDWRSDFCRCYLYVPKLMTWTDAEKNCLSMGGHLASVRSLQEYQDIQRVILDASKDTKETWIGGYNEQQTNAWLWSDGRSFSYTNWCKGEPNNDGGQYCLQVNYSDKKLWDDFQCATELPSVCAKLPI